MRILMMGTGGFAVPTFRSLLESKHDILALVTRPPRPIHGRRRQRVAPNPMRDVAEEHGLSILMPESINNDAAVEQITDFKADLHVVCDYGQILSKAALASSRLGGINLHASLLPRYRGAAPINWALYHGEKRTGVTVIHMTPRLDAGPNLLQRATEIGPDEDAIVLEERLSELGRSAVQDAVKLLEEWDGVSPIGERQDPTLATRAPRLKKSDGAVDWSRSAQQIFDQVRALKPWPGTYTVWQGPRRTMRLVLEQVRVVDEAPAEGAPPGCVIASEMSNARIACGQGALDLEVVQPEGKKRMPIEDFLRGYPLSLSDRLGQKKQQ
jgi:methionyl-tRNA formyltransferase